VKLPRLYAIVDPARLPGSISLVSFVSELIEGGVRLIQYRDKSNSSKQVLSNARELKRLAIKSAESVTLIMNDRADLCLAAGFDGVHLGQDDLSPEGARRVCASPLLIGSSTHNAEQIAAAEREPVDYIAIGPVFATASKANPDPVVGLEGLRMARKLTKKPLVAIGGITKDNCRAVIEAGADSVAVISELLNEPRKSSEEFIRVLR
jgi:thiamine-phosphate pyrophosphorylase